MGGWIIGLAIAGERPWELYAVAEANQERAVQLVSDATQTRAVNDIVEVAGPISAQHLEILGLSPGEVRHV